MHFAISRWGFGGYGRLVAVSLGFNFATLVCCFWWMLLRTAKAFQLLDTKPEFSYRNCSLFSLFPYGLIHGLLTYWVLGIGLDIENRRMSGFLAVLMFSRDTTFYLLMLWFLLVLLTLRVLLVGFIAPLLVCKSNWISKWKFLADVFHSLHCHLFQYLLLPKDDFRTQAFSNCFLPDWPSCFCCSLSSTDLGYFLLSFREWDITYYFNERNFCYNLPFFGFLDLLTICAGMLIYMSLPLVWMGGFKLPSHNLISNDTVLHTLKLLCFSGGGQLYMWGKIKSTGDDWMYPKPLMDLRSGLLYFFFPNIYCKLVACFGFSFTIV